MARRSDHSRDEIKEMALKAGEKIVIEFGYAALTARKIAAGIGYTVGSLYLVFTNLDDLCLQINARTLDEMLAALQDSIEPTTPPNERIHALCRAYVRFAVENPQRWNMIFEHRLPDEADVPEWYQQKILQMFTPIEDQFFALSAEQSDADIAQAARTLWSGVHGICILNMSGQLDNIGAENAERMIDLLSGNFLLGWRSNL